MNRFFAVLTLSTAALAPSPAQDAESGGLDDAFQIFGYQPKTFSAQGLSELQAAGASTYAFGDPTPQEQLTLELINRGRANPTAEAQRFGINLNKDLPAGTISTLPKPPLTFEQSLIIAARGHSQWMLDTDTFSHTGTNGTNSKQRMEAAGYVFTGSWGAGENIAWKGTSGTVNLNDFTVALYEQLFRSASHRVNLMAPAFDQIGVGLKEGKFLDQGTNWNTAMVTQDYAVSASSPSPEGPFVTGVVFRDNNNNGFYDIGEGLGGVSIKVVPGDSTTTTSASGGYAIPLGTTSGVIALTFSGGGVTTAQTATAVVMPGVSVKTDLVLPGVSSDTRIIALSGDLNFGSATVGAAVTRTLTITNTGNSTLSVTGITHSDTAFSGNLAVSVPPKKSKTVTLTFKPTAVQSYSGTLTVNSNATAGVATAVETGAGVPAPVAAAPVLSPAGGTFSKKIRVKISTSTPRATVRYTTDGSEPTPASKKAPKNLNLKESAIVKAKTFKDGYTESPTTTAEFTKAD